MKKKMMLLSVFTLAMCSMAMAAEYKKPDVEFKPHVAPSKEMKTADFGEHYKVETGMGTDRQIASSEDDREPSSVGDKKVIQAEPEAPKPWLYKEDDVKKKY